MSRVLRLGISTCPNDTFAFHGLLAGVIDQRGIALAMELADVEELNRRMLAGELDVAKVSFHAALLMADRVVVLPSGSALGNGVGPLLLAARRGTRPGDPVRGADGVARPARVLCPGSHTTAALLYALFHRGEGDVLQTVFSSIMPALKAGDAEFGVCIHEGRFTWQAQGLSLVEDLGATWEERTGTPLPLGGIVARRDLGPEVLCALTAMIRASIDHAYANRAAALVTMRRHAQELTDHVLWNHVDLYVSEATRDLGPGGRQALEALADAARRLGLITDTRSLEVADDSPEVERALFHLVAADAWTCFQEQGSGDWEPPSLAREGFIHLSFAEQLEGTLKAHFAAVDTVELIRVVPALGDGLRLEPSRGGELFPHLYRPLRRQEIARTWRVGRAGDRWCLATALVATAGSGTLGEVVEHEGCEPHETKTALQFGEATRSSAGPSRGGRCG